MDPSPAASHTASAGRSGLGAADYRRSETGLKLLIGSERYAGDAVGQSYIARWNRRGRSGNEGHPATGRRRRRVKEVAVAAKHRHVRRPPDRCHTAS